MMQSAVRRRYDRKQLALIRLKTGKKAFMFVRTPCFTPVMKGYKIQTTLFK